MEVKEYALSLIHWKIAQDPWTRAVFLAGGVPLDSLAERILDIASSEDPEGMMIRSIERWERILAITPAADAALEERRAAIRMRWLAAAPPSVESLQAICEAWEGGAFAVRYDPARGIILLETAGEEGPKAKPRALKNGIDRAKPAHLAVRLATKATAGLWWGGVTCTADVRGLPDFIIYEGGD